MAKQNGSTRRYVFKGQELRKYTGFQSDDAVRTGIVELTVDWESIVKSLGSKAAFNKSGKSGLAIGIKAKFIRDTVKP